MKITYAENSEFRPSNKIHQLYYVIRDNLVRPGPQHKNTYWILNSKQYEQLCKAYGTGPQPEVQDIANSFEEAEKTLQDKFPTPNPVLKTVKPFPRYWKLVSGLCYQVIVRKPFLDQRVDIETLKNLCQEYKVIHVSKPGFLRNMDLESSGLTETRREGYSQIRYNPKAIARRPYFKELKKYNRSRAMKFNSKIWQSLYNLVCSESWPRNHPHRGFAYTPLSSHSRTLTSIPCRDFTSREFAEMMQLNNRLWKNKFWRTDTTIRSIYGSINSYNMSLECVIKAAWVNIIAVENHNRKVIEELKQTWEAEYYDYVWEQFHHALLDTTPKIEKFEDRIRRITGSEPWDILFACRWLRTEARYLGIDPPKKLKKPLSPSQQEKLARKKSIKNRKRKTKTKPNNQK